MFSISVLELTIRHIYKSFFAFILSLLPLREDSKEICPKYYSLCSPGRQRTPISPVLISCVLGVHTQTNVF